MQGLHSSCMPRTICFKIRIPPSKWMIQRMSNTVYSTRIYDWGTFFLNRIRREPPTHTHCLSFSPHPLHLSSKNKAQLNSLSSFTTDKIKYLPFGKPIQIWFSISGNKKSDLTHGLEEHSGWLSQGSLWSDSWFDISRRRRLGLTNESDVFRRLPGIQQLELDQWKLPDYPKWKAKS